MRSSKNRSRSKGSRNRSVGNIVNRVFDSPGPDGTVRGTPQQIIDKYNQLTRDAQLSNDRVAAENFQQHAEHYLRMLGEAQREMEARREQQQQAQQQQNQPGQGGDQRGSGGQGQQGERADRGDGQRARGGEAAAPEQPSDRAFDAVIDSGEGGGSGLVETPENAPKPKRSRGRRSRKSDAQGGDGAGSEAASGDASGDQSGGPDTPPQEAAE